MDRATTSTSLQEIEAKAAGVESATQAAGLLRAKLAQARVAEVDPRRDRLARPLSDDATLHEHRMERFRLLSEAHSRAVSLFLRLTAANDDHLDTLVAKRVLDEPWARLADAARRASWRVGDERGTILLYKRVSDPLRA